MRCKGDKGRGEGRGDKVQGRRATTETRRKGDEAQGRHEGDKVQGR